MMLTYYESICALGKIYNEPLQDVLDQVGDFYITPDSSAMIIAKNTFAQKVKLVDDKKKALNNISSKTKAMADSNATLLNNAFEASKRAYDFRLSLELSVLTSQLKAIEIEIAKIKLMSAEEFITKYGANSPEGVMPPNYAK